MDAALHIVLRRTENTVDTCKHEHEHPDTTVVSENKCMYAR
jgi:hypothetical protein